MESILTITDPCLVEAHRQWQPFFAEGEAYYAGQNPQAALAPLAEAIRISASYHPLFHFLESGLNTELGIVYLAQQQWAEAEATFERAVFLHHDNATAISGQQLAQTHINAELPRYRTLFLSSPLKGVEGAGGIHTLRKRARKADADAAIALYQEAIQICEQTHLHYHTLTAQPWLARARCFAAQGEDALARNDIRHGMDLDRKNTELLELSLSLAG